MNRTMTRLALGMVLGAQVVLFQNCSATKFTQESLSEASAAGTPNSVGPISACETTLVDSLRTIKILFLVDASGSNRTQFNFLGTDPQKTWRAAAINGIVDRYGSKSNFSFALATFQGSTATPQIRGPSGEAIFSHSSAEVQAGISAFLANTDDNSTPYKSALTLAGETIRRDLAANPNENAAYSVIMVSDGMATDYGSPNEIIPDASALVSIAPGQIKLNGVFYYNDPSQKTAENMAYLKNMANIGSGSFAIANSNQSIQLDDLLKVPKQNCH